MIKKAVIAFSVLAICQGTAQATLLASDAFNYTGALTDNGWTAHSGAGNKVIMADGSTAALDQSGGSGEDINLAFTSSVTTTDTFYVRLDVTLPSGQTVDPDANGLYFAHLKDSGFAFRGRTGVVSPQSGGDFAFAINADSSGLGDGVAWATDGAFDTTYRLIYSWDAVTGASSLWVDPLNESSTSVSHTGGNSGDLIEAVALRQSNDFTGSILVDNVQVATTFAEAIPEPGTLALLSIGFGLLAYRRRHS